MCFFLVWYHIRETNHEFLGGPYQNVCFSLANNGNVIYAMRILAI